MQNDLVTVMI